jgi:hypothetical protein
MARQKFRTIPKILEAAAYWKSTCLLSNGSLFEVKELWTPDNLLALHTAFIDNPVHGALSFYKKLEKQLQNESPEICQLAAEMTWVLLVFSSNISGETKRKDVQNIWSWSGQELPSDHPLLGFIIDEGVGSTGVAFNTHRWREFGYFIEAIEAWKKLDLIQQQELIKDAWKFGEWLHGLPVEGFRQFSGVMPYLLFPDHYERITHPGQKNKIIQNYWHEIEAGDPPTSSQLSKLSLVERDKIVYRIRETLQKRFPDDELDFYIPPISLEFEILDKERQYKYWVEKTIVKGRPDREAGELAFGKVLWSPQVDSGNKKIYESMKRVNAGDVIIHLTDNEAITGVSFAQEIADSTFVCPEGTDWAGRPGFLIYLYGFTRLEPSLNRDDFLKKEPYATELQNILVKNKGLFYNSNLDLNQGKYLSEAPSELVRTLANAYADTTGLQLPHIPLDELPKSEDTETPSSTTNKCWIFQANPKMFDIDSALREFESISWSVSQHAPEIKKGDKVYIWRSGKDAGVVAEATILTNPEIMDEQQEQSKYWKVPFETGLRVICRIDKVLNPPLLKEKLRELDELKSLSILRYFQGTNFPVTPDEAKVIENLINMPISVARQPKYTISDFSHETKFPVENIEQWLSRLRRKKQIVFQGPPGTGKTFLAERLAKLVLSESQGLSDLVQFHPSYAYEDFMKGIRPEVIDGQLSFNLCNGRFVKFCIDARSSGTDEPCVLIIDELNRANLSRVFGELMYLLEYRDKSIPLAGGGEYFQVPNNVYLIGTMNTADRSIALVDHALRRRFSFIFIGPEYDVLGTHLKQLELPDESLIQALQHVNAAINDRNYEIGISFFLNDGSDLKATLPSIWQGEIEPYLEEYFYDQPEKVDAFRWSKLSLSILADWL